MKLYVLQNQGRWGSETVTSGVGPDPSGPEHGEASAPARPSVEMSSQLSTGVHTVHPVFRRRKLDPMAFAIYQQVESWDWNHKRHEMC